MTLRHWYEVQVAKALRFFVFATKEDLFKYMELALTYGPYRDLTLERAEKRIKYRVDHAITCLTLLYTSVTIGYHSASKCYHINNIGFRDGRRQEISKLIFDAILDTMVDEGQNYATYLQIRDRIEEATEPRQIVTQTGAAIARLQVLDCVTKNGTRYAINFEDGYNPDDVYKPEDGYDSDSE